MQLNGIELIGYSTAGTTARFTLATDMVGALALNGQDLIVTEGEEELAVFGGDFSISSVERDGENVCVTFDRTLEPSVAKSISAMQCNVAIAGRQSQKAESISKEANQTASDLASQVEINSQAIEEIAASVFAE